MENFEGFQGKLGPDGTMFMPAGAATVHRFQVVNYKTTLSLGILGRCQLLTLQDFYSRNPVSTLSCVINFLNTSG